MVELEERVETEHRTGVTYDLKCLSYGDLRRLQSMDATALTGQDTLAAILDKVVIGGLDAIPLLAIKAVVVELMAEITEAMSGKNEQAALS